MTADEKAQNYRTICSKVTLQEKKEGFFLSLASALSDKVDLAVFSRCATDFEKVKFVSRCCWNLLAAEPFYRGKKEEESVARRLEGNKFFEKGDHPRALLNYCQSIIIAPVGPHLVSSYVNRSALLHKMGEYEMAIADAELAISYGYPENTRHKIYERMASCHFAMKNYHKAKVILRLAKHFAEKNDKDNAKLSQKLEKLSSSIASAMQDEKNGNVKDKDKMNSPGSLQKENVNFKPGKKFPSACDKFDVKYALGTGRSAFTKKKVDVGEEILREKPFASVLSTEKMGTFCLHCFARLKAPISCDTCSNVAFCSRQCKKDAEAYHKYECRIMLLLIGSGMSLNVYLALRIITQGTAEQFLKLYPTLSNKPEEIPTTEKGQLDSSYPGIYNLGGLEDHREPQDFLNRTIMAVFLMKCLRQVGYFELNLFLNPLPTEQEMQIGALILRNLQVVQFNAYEVCEFLMDNPQSYKKSTSSGLGLAIYSTASYFNHSCAPNLARYFIGTTMVATAITPIAAGQPLSDNYGPYFTKAGKDDRRVKLEGRYWFHCTCDACVNDWPRLQDAIVEITPKNAEETKVLKKLQSFEPLYFDSGMKAMEAGKPRIAIELFKKYISESESLLLNHRDSSFYPYKSVLLAQEGMKLCLCSLGSVHYAKETA